MTQSRHQLFRYKASRRPVAEAHSTLETSSLVWTTLVARLTECMTIAALQPLGVWSVEADRTVDYTGDMLDLTYGRWLRGLMTFGRGRGRWVGVSLRHG